jgi:hypothetical protein
LFAKGRIGRVFAPAIRAPHKGHRPKGRLNALFLALNVR